MSSDANLTTRLSSFLPYDLREQIHAKLRSSLGEYRCLVLSIIETVNHFSLHHLDRFDPLVKENQCQVRAFKVVQLALERTLDTTPLLEKAKQVSSTIQALLLPKQPDSSKDSIFSLMRHSNSLADVLEIKQLEVYLTSDWAFLVKSFILTEMKIYGEPSSAILLAKTKNTCPQFFEGASNSFARRLTQTLRDTLSKDSVEIVQSLVAELSPVIDHVEWSDLMSKISTTYIKSVKGHACIPMFWCYKALLHGIKQFSIPLLLHVKIMEKTEDGIHIQKDQECVVYKGLDTTISIEQLAPQSPLFVVQGIVVCKHPHSMTKEAWRQKIANYQPTDMILAGAADHCQYPASLHDNCIEPTEEFLKYKKSAVADGFSIDYPTTFFIQHVYPSTQESFQQSFNVKKEERH